MGAKHFGVSGAREPKPGGSPQGRRPRGSQADTGEIVIAHRLVGERFLVTGGCGFVGTGLVRALRAVGARVKVADLRPFPDPEVPTVVGDLRDDAVRRRAFEPPPAGVIHLAALTSVLESVRRPVEFHEVNVDVTAALLELCREHDVRRFLFASTNAVTGDVGRQTIHEDMPLRPLTPYGGSKAAAEMLLSAYTHTYGMRACALRLTNVYGPGMRGKDSFIPRLMRAACSGEEVDIYGDGHQSRDLVHLDDVCQAFGAVWQAEHGGPLIVGSGHSVEVLDLVEAVRSTTGSALPTRHVQAKPGEMPAVVVDITRARRLGYDPDIDLSDGLASVWRDFGGEPPALLEATGGYAGFGG
ncbi:MAG: NAD-dependent epimerase/dehydratase family protein [Streptosporangiaceae bacterium]